MVIERLQWVCEHNSPLRIIALKLSLWIVLSEELADFWESQGRQRPDGVISELRGAQFVEATDAQGLYFADRCVTSMESIMSVKGERV